MVAMPSMVAAVSAFIVGVAPAEKSRGHRNPAMGPAQAFVVKNSTSNTLETGSLILSSEDDLQLVSLMSRRQNASRKNA